MISANATVDMTGGTGLGGCFHRFGDKRYSTHTWEGYNGTTEKRCGPRHDAAPENVAKVAPSVAVTPSGVAATKTFKC